MSGAATRRTLRRGLAALALAGTLALSGAGSARAATPPATPAPTVPAPGATPTTLVPIANDLPAPPTTVTVVPRPESTHVDPWLAKACLAGFALFLLLLVAQSILTRRGRQGRWTL